MRYAPVKAVDLELDERYFPMAFVSRCVGDEPACVWIRVFDPADEQWHFITLDQWRFVLQCARTLH